MFTPSIFAITASSDWLKRFIFSTDACYQNLIPSSTTDSRLEKTIQTRTTIWRPHWPKQAHWESQSAPTDCLGLVLWAYRDKKHHNVSDTKHIHRCAISFCISYLYCNEAFQLYYSYYSTPSSSLVALSTRVALSFTSTSGTWFIVVPSLMTKLEKPRTEDEQLATHGI